MARYTDIDLLFDKVEETVWYHINKNGELVFGANSETDIPLYKHTDIMRVLAEAPEADVAPRSEVDYWKQQCFFACMNNGCLDDKVIASFTKAEAAMEIFEEIERLIEITAFADCWSEGGFKDDIAELKKKYTEGIDPK